MHDLVRRIKMLEYALKAERSVPLPLSLSLSLPLPPFPLPPSSVSNSQVFTMFVCLLSEHKHGVDRCQYIKPTQLDLFSEYGFIFPLTFHCIVMLVHGCDNNYLWCS